DQRITICADHRLVAGSQGDRRGAMARPDDRVQQLVIAAGKPQDGAGQKIIANRAVRIGDAGLEPEIGPWHAADRGAGEDLDIEGPAYRPREYRRGTVIDAQNNLGKAGRRSKNELPAGW